MERNIDVLDRIGRACGSIMDKDLYVDLVISMDCMDTLSDTLRDNNVKINDVKDDVVLAGSNIAMVGNAIAFAMGDLDNGKYMEVKELADGCNQIYDFLDSKNLLSEEILKNPELLENLLIGMCAYSTLPKSHAKFVEGFSKGREIGIKNYNDKYNAPKPKENLAKRIKKALGRDKK